MLITLNFIVIAILWILVLNRMFNNDILNKELLSWNIEKDSMIVEIKYSGKTIMSFFLGEALEVVGRKEIMKHIKEIENTPWIYSWHGK